jgi:hypothetical protein
LLRENWLFVYDRRMSFKSIFNYLVGTPRYLELNRDSVGFPAWAVHLRRSGLYASIVGGAMVAMYVEQEGKSAAEAAGWGGSSAALLYVMEDRRKKRQQTMLAEAFGGEKCIDTRPAPGVQTGTGDMEKVREMRQGLIYGVPFISGPLLAIGWGMIGPVSMAFIVPDIFISGQEIGEYNRILRRHWAIIPRVRDQEFVKETSPKSQNNLRHG